MSLDSVIDGGKGVDIFLHYILDDIAQKYITHI